MATGITLSATENDPEWGESNANATNPRRVTLLTEPIGASTVATNALLSAEHFPNCVQRVSLDRNRVNLDADDRLA